MKKSFLSLILVSAMLSTLVVFSAASGEKITLDCTICVGPVIGLPCFDADACTRENNIERDSQGMSADGWNVHGRAPILPIDATCSDGKSAIIRALNDSRTFNEGVRFTDEEKQQLDSFYKDNRILELKEFYLPTIKIDGFELYRIEINSRNFRFLYASPGRDYEEMSQNYRHGSGFCVTISRPNTANYVAEYRKSVSENFHTQDWLRENGIIFITGSGIITVPMDDMSVSIEKLSKSNDYEYLRDLAFRVIDSVKLVNVDREIARMTANGELPTATENVILQAETQDMAVEHTEVVQFDYGINDVLEILKSLAGLPSAYDMNSSTPLSVTPQRLEPTIGNALEILKKLAGLPSSID
jgi:hypothetical protein